MKKLGKYEIIGILGKGAMGIVYKALDPDINREVAIKTIRFDLTSDEADKEELMERFMREAQAAGKLTHPNIITIYDVGREKDMTYIVMQYVEGQSLQKMIRAGERLSTHQVIHFMDQLCNALEYAHRHKIVHRDIKPANILLDKDGKPLIVDFGVARVETSTLTQSGTVVGTPSYMSPEQVRGKKVDKRSDIFSLGGILYELLTGKRAFEADSITTIIFKIINEEPRAITEVKRGLPSGFEKIITKALAKDPEDRYQTCSQFAADLRNLVQVSEKTVAVGLAEEEPTILEKRKKLKLAPILAISIAAVLLAAAGGVYFIYQKTGKIPFLPGKIQEMKTEEPSLPSQPKAVTPDTIEDKLMMAKESFEKEDYAETVRLAEEVLREDAGNISAQEYLDKAKSKMDEAMIAQTLTKEEIEAEKPSLPSKPKTDVPPGTEDKLPMTDEERKAKESQIPPEAKAVIPGSTEDKLMRAKESFEKEDYTETITLAGEVLAKYPRNKKAQEYLDKAKNKILIVETLEAGISSYKKRNYRKCKQEMDKILKLDKEHKEAKRYWNLADEAIYKATSVQEIQKIVELVRKAEEDKDLPVVLYYIGSSDLKNIKRTDSMFIFNNFDDIKSLVDESSISIEFKGRNQAEVIFSNFSTAISKKTSQRTKLFEGDIIWTMEKQGNVWKIIKEDKKER